MTVQAIRFENFMAFADTGWIWLRPITLLFGRNSSGKSAINRGLRLLKQSLDNAPNGRHLTFITEDGLDQGTFEETVHKKELNRQMNFHFRCRTGAATLEKMRSGTTGRQTTESTADGIHRCVDLMLGFAWNEDAQWTELSEVTLKDSWAVEQHEIQQTLFRAQRVDKELLAETGSPWVFETDLLQGHEQDEETTAWMGFDFELRAGFLPLLPQKTFFEELASAADYGVVQTALQDLQATIETFLRGINYLGPVRPEPQRVYILDHLAQDRWQRQGWKVLFDFLMETIDQPQLKQVDSWLEHLGLGHKIEDLKKAQAWGVTASQVKIRETEEESLIVNLRDVGFGASQVLPVIVQSILASPGSLIVIEQPELHLHPQAQAALADLFIDYMKITGAHFILETHSEHLMLRFRRRIAETTCDFLQPTAGDYPRNQGYFLERQSFGLLFVERKGGRSSVEFIEVDHQGQLLNPSNEFHNFFNDDFDEAIQLAKAKAIITGFENTYESEN